MDSYRKAPAAARRAAEFSAIVARQLWTLKKKQRLEPSFWWIFPNY